MSAIDRLGQRLRIRKARPFIDPGSRVLDIGCADGMLFRLLDGTITEGVGVDPDAPESWDHRFTFIRDTFPTDLEGRGEFDVVVALAMLEHVPMEQQDKLAAACFRLLRPRGRMVITVPAPAVDPIIHVTQFLRLIDGMATEQHYGFRPALTAPLFERAGFRLVTRQHFQLALNNLFVFIKPG